jgi:hypothetical protein
MDTNKQESREDKIRKGAEDFANRFTGVMKELAEDESHEGVEKLVKEFAEIWHNYPAASPTEYKQRQMQLTWLREKLTSLNTKKHE